MLKLFISSFQNIMTFNKCSIAGRSYGDIVDERTGETIEINEVCIQRIYIVKKFNIYFSVNTWNESIYIHTCMVCLIFVINRWLSCLIFIVMVACTSNMNNYSNNGHISCFKTNYLFHFSGWNHCSWFFINIWCKGFDVCLSKCFMFCVSYFYQTNEFLYLIALRIFSQGKLFK